MGFFTRLALAASQYVLMPLSPGVFAEFGDDLLRRTIETSSALTGAEIELLGCVITQWKGDALDQNFLDVIERSLKVVGEKVPVDRNIERAHLDVAQGRRKTLLDRNTKAAAAYLAVIEEVVRRVQSGPNNQEQGAAVTSHVYTRGRE